MLKIKSITLLAAALTLGATASFSGTRDIHKHGKFFQNVKAEHVQPLLTGTAYISHIDYEGPGKTSSSGGEVAIYWHSANGLRTTCIGTPSKGNAYGIGQWKFQGIQRNSKYLKAQHPLIQFARNGKTTGHELIRYDASTGALTTYWYQKLRWWEMDKGHLQTELPAVTWDLCPDFPSAKSLGARVNKKQTAKFYLDLVRQDPGKRVRKPQYQAKEPTVVWLDRFGKELKPRK